MGSERGNFRMKNQWRSELLRRENFLLDGENTIVNCGIRSLR